MRRKFPIKLSDSLNILNCSGLSELLARKAQKLHAIYGLSCGLPPLLKRDGLSARSQNSLRTACDVTYLVQCLCVCFSGHKRWRLNASSSFTLLHLISNRNINPGYGRIAKQGTVLYSTARTLRSRLAAATFARALLWYNLFRTLFENKVLK